jgi:hypothetical protein
VASADCSGGRECYTLGSGAGICLAACTEGQALCAQGEACAPAAVTETDWVCLPGGNVAIGGVCDRSIDCDLGGLCVTETAFSLCRRACDPRVPTCLAGSVCHPWTAERGYCAPAPAGVDMGMSAADAGAP